MPPPPHSAQGRPSGFVATVRQVRPDKKRLYWHLSLGGMERECQLPGATAEVATEERFPVSREVTKGRAPSVRGSQGCPLTFLSYFPLLLSERRRGLGG